MYGYAELEQRGLYVCGPVSTLTLDRAEAGPDPGTHLKLKPGKSLRRLSVASIATVQQKTTRGSSTTWTRIVTIIRQPGRRADYSSRARVATSSAS